MKGEGAPPHVIEARPGGILLCVLVALPAPPHILATAVACFRLSAG